MNELVTQPIVQYGFLGFSAVLLGVVIWLIQKLLGVLKINRSLHDKIISRPCIATGEM